VLNGDIASRVTYTFLLEPQSPGNYVIPTLSLQVGDEVLRTAPIPITVRSAAPGGRTDESVAAPADEPELFVVTSVDKKSPVVGEPVTLTFRFVTRVPLAGDSQYQPPDTTGFIAEDLPPQRNFSEIRAGRRAQVVELKTALFPTTSGKLTIGPAGLVCGVRVTGGAGPFGDGFFDDMFARVRQITLRSDPLTLNVRPLPTEDRPDGFKGDVGDYEIQAVLDKTDVRQHEPVTLTVTVSGEGNIKALSAPALPTLNEFKVYDTLSSVNITKTDGRVRGSKVFTTILKPDVSGTVTLPPISYSFYDPARGRFRTAQSSPLRLYVRASTGTAAGFSPAVPLAPEGVRVVNDDIRFIKTRGSLHPRRPPAHRRRIFALGQWIPGTLWVLILGALALHRRGRADHRGRAFRRARTTAERGIREAIRALRRGDVPSTLDLLQRAERQYWADKTGRPAPSLTWEDARDALDWSDGDDLRRRTERLWHELDQARFTPGLRTPESAEALIRELLDLLKSLDQKWSRS
jgi:hypothetical protein